MNVSNSADGIRDIVPVAGLFRQLSDDVRIALRIARSVVR
jgi:hypothetical protein